MIEPTVIFAITALVSLGAFGILLVRLQRLPDRRRYPFVLVGVVLGTTAITTGLQAAGLGLVQVPGTSVTLPSVVDDAVGYSLLWLVTAWLAGAPRDLRLTAGAIPFVQVLAFHFGATAGGLVGLASTAVVIGGWAVLAGLFGRPIWRHAREQPARRRLLHWKARNLLLFLVGMLIVFAFLAIGGTFTSWASLLIAEYIGLLIRVGFAGFLLANADALSSKDRQETPASGPATASAT